MQVTLVYMKLAFKINDFSFSVAIWSIIAKRMVAKGLSFIHFELHAFCQEATLLDLSPKQGLLGYHACFMAVSPAPKHILVWWSCPELFHLSNCRYLCCQFSDLFCFIIKVELLICLSQCEGGSFFWLAVSLTDPWPLSVLPSCVCFSRPRP